MNVAVLDLGAGNLHSIARALAACGATPRIESDPDRALAADALVLPGVGAFGAAAARLEPARVALRAALVQGLPCLGICLGMQLLFEGSDEGDGQGIGLLPGRVRRLVARRAPHMGWNSLAGEDDALFTAAPLETAYFAHTFVAPAGDARSVIAWSEHEGDRFPAAVRIGRTVGVQFHPEKSSRAGVAFVGAWLAEAGR